MKRLASSALIVACGLLVAAPRWSQEKKDDGEGRVRITLYRIAPGRHLDFLKWMAARDEAAREAGVPAVQLYAHLDGDAWDYAGMEPVRTPEQDKRVDEAAARKGLKTGLAAWLEFRALVAWHTDTFAVGPATAAELVAQAAK